MAESDNGEGRSFEKELFMSVVGHEFFYERSRFHVESGPEMVSSAQLKLSVQGATVEHHGNRPIRFAHVRFGEGPFDADRAGRLRDLGPGIGVNIIATLPRADFPAVWAALNLEGEVTLVCGIEVGEDEVGTDNVLGLRVHGQRPPAGAEVSEIRGSQEDGT
jgi:hypothetical protein